MAVDKKRSPVITPDGTKTFLTATSVIPGFGLSVGVTLTMGSAGNAVVETNGDVNAEALKAAVEAQDYKVLGVH